jgi:hypothetical protein
MAFNTVRGAMRYSWLPFRKWPLEGAVTISLFSLLVSLSQCVTTVPLIVDFYIRPNLVVIGHKGEDGAIAMFKIRNDGNKSATKIEFGFLVPPGYRENIIPNVDNKIVRDVNQNIIQNIRVEFDRISPGEKMGVVLQFWPEHDEDKDKLLEVRHALEAAGAHLPAFSFVRSAEGEGQFRIEPRLYKTSP